MINYFDEKYCFSFSGLTCSNVVLHIPFNIKKPPKNLDSLISVETYQLLLHSTIFNCISMISSCKNLMYAHLLF